VKPLVIDHGTRSIELDPPLVLAPLAGHTDRAFRALVRRLGGCGLVVTEMVSSEGLTRGSKASREIASVTEGERPVGVQLFGTDPHRLADSAVIVEELGANLVDVNMGCPVPKVTRLGAGAALMRDIGRVTELISEMVRSAGIPVTAKIRSGWDHESINAREVALALEQAGAAAITVHPRCRSERHRGRAAWQVIRDVKEAVKVPVIGNGDVRSAEDARAMIAETGADGIMIGRGALENPWVFRQIRDELAGADPWKPKTEDYRAAVGFFIESLADYLPEKLVVNRVKALTGWISKGFPGGGALRQNVYASKSLGELRHAFETHFEATCESIAPSAARV
jgi:nifR3 family TIM-barrel protein